MFDLQAFIAAPSQELLNLAKKSDLLDIAAHYELTSVNKSMLKQEIKISWFNFRLIRKDLILDKVFFISQIPLEDHFPHNQDPNIVLEFHLAVMAKHLLLNPNLLVKTRIKIPYLNKFAIIAKRQVMLFLNTYKGMKEKTRGA